MPIIAKAEIARRKAARAAAAAATASISSATTPPANSAPVDTVVAFPERTDPGGSISEASLPTPAVPYVPSRKKQRGHAVRDEDGKYQPTADYPSGFARPPEHSRFKPGGKGGPGRPKGAVSHDKLLAKHLQEKREVTIGGKRQRITNRELLIISTLKSALEGKDKHARAYALAQTERLFRDQESAADSISGSVLSEGDALSIAEFEAELREQVRAELMADRVRSRDGGEGDE